MLLQNPTSTGLAMTYFNDPETVAYHHLEHMLSLKLPDLGKFLIDYSPADLNCYLRMRTLDGITFHVDLHTSNPDKLTLDQILQCIDEQYPELNI
jgi:hypothetical protein